MNFEPHSSNFFVLLPLLIILWPCYFQMSLSKASKSGARTYRERHQPQERGHLGLLEKRKDYKLRANDYNSKKEVLKHLRQKALNKNPDEFYFHMINSKTVDGGMHRDLVSSKSKQKKADPHGHHQRQIQLMQTQDHKYVAMRRLMERRKIEKLQGSLHLLDRDSDTSNTHTIFVEDESEKKTMDLAQHLDTAPVMLGRTTHRPRKEDLKKLKPAQEVGSSSKKAYRQLKQRLEREKRLAIVEAKMKVRRELSGPKTGPSAAVLRPETAEQAPLLRWQTERKRWKICSSRESLIVNKMFLFPTAWIYLLYCVPPLPE